MFSQYESKALNHSANLRKVDPHNYQTLSTLGMAYIETGKLEEAIQTFKKVSQIDQRDPFALGNLSWAYKHSGRTDKGSCY
jgi:Flp pilus assembly protein TadD